MLEITENLVKEVNSAFSNWRKEISILEELLDEGTKKKLFGSSDSKSNLKQQLNEMRISCDTLSGFIQDKEEEIKNYLTMISGIGLNMEDKKNEIMLIENEIIKKNSHLHRINQSLEEKNQILTKIDLDIETQNSVYSNLTSDLQKLENKKTTLTSETEKISKEFEEIKSNKTDRNAEIEQRTKEIENLDSSISERKNKISSDESYIKSLEEKIIELKFQAQKYGTDYEKYLNEKTTYENDILIKKEILDSIEKSIESNKINSEQYSKELIIIQDELNESAKQKKIINTDINKLQSFKDYLDAEVRKFKPYLEKLEKSKEDYYQMSSEVVKLHTERVKLENKLPLLKENIEIENIRYLDIQRKFDELSVQCNSLESQKIRLEAEISAFNSTIPTLKSEKESLEKQLDVLYNKDSDFAIIRDKFQKEKNILEQKIIELKDKNEKIVNELTTKELLLIETTATISEKQLLFNDLLNEIDHKRLQTKEYEKEHDKYIEEKKISESDIATLEDKRKLLKNEIDKLENRKDEITKELSPFENQYAENSKKISEQKLNLENLSREIDAKEKSYQKILIDQSDKTLEFQSVKETHLKLSSELEKLQSEIKDDTIKKDRILQDIGVLETKISDLELLKKNTQESLPAQAISTQIDTGGKEKLISLQQKIDEIFANLTLIKPEMSEAASLSKSMPRTMSQSFNDIKEVFNKFKDFMSKYNSFDQMTSELESKAIKGEPKILDIFFKNRDLAMKEQDRIYNLISVLKMTGKEAKDLIDLYNMMLPDDILNSCEIDLSKGLEKFTNIINKINIESDIQDISNHIKELV